MSGQLQSALGLIVIPLLALAASEDRRAFTATGLARMAAVALALQIAIAGLMLNVAVLRGSFEWIAGLVGALQAASNAGMRLVFGYLAGGPAPFDIVKPENGFVLAFQALPLILLVSALSRLLYHWGVLQAVVGAFAWALSRSLGVSGPVGTSAAANIFVGMVEAPLLVRPYLVTMSRSALFATMTVGMATIAGTVLALYASLLSASLPGAAGHMVVASVISAPAALLIAFLMVPPGAEETQDGDTPPMAEAEPTGSSMDAIVAGTRDGITLLANVAALLVVFVALVHLANQILALAGAPFGIEVSVEMLLGWAMAPLAWLIGIPASESVTAGALIGIKTVLNEFVAYLRLAETGAQELSGRSRLILTYALCGFANFGSLGIMIGGLCAMAPERRGEIISLGLKTIVSGTLATLMTGAVIGVMTTQ
ncbi:MAG: nucleoside:proton symporter [Rhizobiales bacterium]|nr:nucleoside:proton symporter [Hyphomicrobiales bacterium]